MTSYFGGCQGQILLLSHLVEIPTLRNTGVTKTASRKEKAIYLNLTLQHIKDGN